MNLKMLGLRLLPAVGAICLIAASLPVRSASAAPSYRVLVSGLDNPRGLAWDATGQLWVAEAGKGGDGPCMESPEGGKACFGLTGAITRVYQGGAQRIVTGLPSVAGEDGSNAGGPHDVAVLHPGELKVVVGLGGTTADRDTLGAPATALGRLLQVSHRPPGLKADIDWTHAADLAAYERTNNPDGGENDSNPYSAVTDAAGNAVVADAGGNSLLKVSRDGQISTLATFPDRLVAAPAFLGLPAGAKIPMQSVPTSVVRGQHGEYYVGELTGFPFQAGGARVYLVNDTRNAKPQVLADGFTNIVDMAMGKDGSLYVLEIAKDGLLAAGDGLPTGAIIKLSPFGQKTVLMTDGLVAPTGIAIGPDNALYVSNHGTSAGMGEILRINL